VIKRDIYLNRSLTNPHNIANALTCSINDKINPALVSNYIQYTIDSFLVDVVKRCDVKGKKYFKYPGKYYYTNLGRGNAGLNYRQYDPEHRSAI
jgi:predicted AAA+ superfamily ATPase